MIKSPVKAIRAKCLECSCGKATEVRACPITDCPLFPFRFGKNPYRKPISEERRQILSERAKKLFSRTSTEEKSNVEIYNDPDDEDDI